MSNRSQLEILALVVEAVGPADALRIVDPAAIPDEAWKKLVRSSTQQPISTGHRLVRQLIDGGYIQHQSGCENPVRCTCGLDEIMLDLDT